MVSTNTINGNIFYFCYFCQWYAREGRPGCTCEFELTHGSENRLTHFSRSGLVKDSNHNRGR